eukprot:3225403-Lingulodinium_polyedra.AAC.1
MPAVIHCPTSPRSRLPSRAPGAPYFCRPRRRGLRGGAALPEADGPGAPRAPAAPAGAPPQD